MRRAGWGRVEGTVVRLLPLTAGATRVGIADGQDGAGGLADDPLGHRAQQDVAQARPAVGGDDDQVDLLLVGVIDDRLDRASPPHRRDHRGGFAPGGVEQAGRGSPWPGLRSPCRTAAA